MKLCQIVSRLAAAGVLVASAASTNAAVLLSEEFDSVPAALGAGGWVRQNNSTAPVGTPWTQGNPAVFTAYSGADDSYAVTNFEGTSTVGGSISNWLMTPEIPLDTSASLQFAMRLLGDGYVDTVEVYLSSSGASTDVGSTTTSTGVFSLLQSFSSNVDTGWVIESIDVASFGPGATGRLAFRYFVQDTSVDGNYVGIDSVSLTTRDVVTVPEPAPVALLALALAGMATLRRRR